MIDRLYYPVIKAILLCLVVFTTFTAQAQQKYWIYLREQNSPDRDGQKSLVHLRSHHLTPVVYSQWLNAVSVVLPDSLLAPASHWLCVDHLEPVDRRLKLHRASTVETDFSIALKQIHAEVLIQAGLSGKEIKIGIIDAGFMHADRNNSLEKIIANGQVKGYRNFIEKERNEPYNTPGKFNDYHGTRVWTYIGGYREDKASHDGLAPGAFYYLARTDQSDKEYPGEEDYWIAAVEWMHEQGVRLVNSSLGYSTGFDDPSHNYSPQQANGESSAISKFANIAVQDKGMILIMSAGNDGDNAFGVINIPADAKGVLAVGATLSAPWTRQSYSSTGLPDLGFVKPDIACYSGMGTSFSAPVITGLAACIMEARPDLNNLQVINMIKRSGHLHLSPNNYLGNGVPDVRKVLAMIHDHQPEEILREITAKKQVNVKVKGRYPVVFHKSDPYTVIRQQEGKARRGSITVKRPDGVLRTTISTTRELIEIHWED